MGLVSLRLKPLLRRVWCGYRAQVHGSNLRGASNGVEDPLTTLLRFALGIHLHSDDIPRRIRDNNTERVWHSGSRISAYDTDFCSRNAQAPETTSKAIQESTKGLLDLRRLKREDRREVNENMVKIRVVVSNNLKSIQN